MWKLNLFFWIYFISFIGRIIDGRVPSTLIISPGVPAKDKDEKSVKTLQHELKRDNDDYIDTTQTKDVPFFPKYTGKTWKPVGLNNKTLENYTNKNKPIINDGNQVIDKNQEFRRKAKASSNADSDVSGEEIKETEESPNAEETVQQTQNISKTSTVPQQAFEENQKLTPIMPRKKTSMKSSWLPTSTPLVQNITQVLRSADKSSEPNKKKYSERMKLVPRVVDDSESLDDPTKDRFRGVFTDLSYISASRERIVPDPVQIDMAVAKGHRVQDLRFKHRLCDRNILLPEGPKYDSKGKIYLEEFQGNEIKTFANTKKPSLVLPKCCNCCRKSVLGCQ